MSCELTESVLHGYIDGELDAARAADFERHLVSCPQCTSALESQETLRSSIQRVGLYERAPVALRRKVEAQFRMPAPVAIAPVRARMRPTHWLAVAAALILAIFISGRLLTNHSGMGIQPALASEILDAHLARYSPANVTSSPRDQHTRRLFDSKVDFAPGARPRERRLPVARRPPGCCKRSSGRSARVWAAQARRECIHLANDGP